MSNSSSDHNTKFHTCLQGNSGQFFLIAEVAQAHDGSLGNAHALLDLAADCGAHAIKFQTHFAEAESSPGEPWRVPFSVQDESRYQYWGRMEFSPEQWAGLKRHADERGLFFLSSPFSFKALQLLERLHCPAWKVASGEVGHTRLLQAMADTGKPVLLSTGMSDEQEIDRLVTWFKRAGNDLVLFQCTSAYPTPPEFLGLSQLPKWQARHGIPVGLSDHSGSPFAGLLAAALGASFIEVHLCFHKACFGPDTTSSLNPEQLQQLAAGLRFAEQALAPYDKNEQAHQLRDVRKMFSRSLFYSRDLPMGTLLASNDLILKKPGGGIGPSEENRITGKMLKRAVQAGDLVAWEHLEES